MRLVVVMKHLYRNLNVDLDQDIDFFVDFRF